MNKYLVGLAALVLAGCQKDVHIDFSGPRKYVVYVNEKLQDTENDRLELPAGYARRLTIECNSASPSREVFKLDSDLNYAIVRETDGIKVVCYTSEAETSFHLSQSNNAK